MMPSRVLGTSPNLAVGCFVEKLLALLFLSACVIGEMVEN
jgi:hypothetical protein